MFEFSCDSLSVERVILDFLFNLSCYSFELIFHLSSYSFCSLFQISLSFPVLAFLFRGVIDQQGPRVIGSMTHLIQKLFSFALNSFIWWGWASHFVAKEYSGQVIILLWSSWITPGRVRFSQGFSFGVQKMSKEDNNGQSAWLDFKSNKKKRCARINQFIFTCLCMMYLFSRLSKCVYISHLWIICSFLRDWFSVLKMNLNAVFLGGKNLN